MINGTSQRSLVVRRVSEVGALLTQTYEQWNADGAPRMAAALAYYTTLSLAPLLLLVIAVAGVVFGTDVVRGNLVHQISTLTGTDSARVIEDMLAGAKPSSGVFASAIGTLMLLIGASGVVGELENAFDRIWKVPPVAESYRALMWKRVASLGMVLGVGFLLLVSLVLDTVLAAASRYFSSRIPGNEILWLLVEMLASFAVVTVLFAMLFRFLPSVTVRWADIWIGAIATAAFFDLGKVLIGLYLGRTSVASSYGAAGSLVVILVWIYYTAQILLFGAELTYVYASRRRRVARALDSRVRALRSGDR